MERGLKRLFAVVLVISMMAVCLPMSIYGYTSSNTYISEIAITSSTNGTGAKAALSAAGYTVIDSDLNNGAGGEYCYLGYKTTNDYMQAIKNIVCRQSNTTAPSGYSALGKIGNWTNFANYGTDGGNIYFYYTKNDNSSSTAISHLTVSITQSSSENDSIIKNYDTNLAMDINKGCGKGTPYIYVYTNISVHSHSLIDSVSDRNYHECSGCSYRQKHSWTDDKCSICGITCSHQYITDNGFCPCGLECEEPKLVDNYYQIANYGNLVWLQEYVNAGNQGVNAILTADITANKNLLDSNGDVQGTPKYNWTPINNYQGIFNGAGYTISGLYSVDSKKYCGFLGYLYINGVVKNLSVKDSFFGNETTQYCGGISGAGAASSKIENCFSNATVKGDYYCGGISGQVQGYISNCLYVGKISDNYTSNAITSDYYGRGTISNCYYIDSCELSSNRASSVTAEQLASGEVCYSLNSNQNSINWYQNIDKGIADLLPVLNTVHYAVIKNGTGYTNDLTYCTHTWYGGKCIICGLQCTHNKIENGFCSNCDFIEEAKLVDDYYEIDNYGKLVWLQRYINNGNTSVNARLIADITANENLLDESGNVQGTPKYNWTPIGTSTVRYQGIFDGAGYNISGLYCVDVQKYCGLMGYLDNSVVKNLSVTDSLFGNETTYYCGAIAGEVMTSSRVENCFSSASIKGRYYCGGIAGETRGCVSDCLYVGKISEADASNAITSDKYEYGTINNCYYIDSCGLTSDRASSVTAEQLASGEVCYNLNSNQSSINWYQNIDKGSVDLLPVLNTAHYAVAKSVTGYTNDLTYCTHMWYEGKCIICGAQCTHNEFDNGFCADCSSPEEAKLVDDYYEIDNYGKLVWLQKYVNNGNTSVNIRLTADITANENLLDESGNVQGTPKYNWTPIGAGNVRYQGIFDGAGYNISGLYCVDVSEHCALVGYLGADGVIKNLSVTDSFFGNEETKSCGTIIGMGSTSSKIENCFSSASIKGRYGCGGIAGGMTGDISNCLYVGKISGVNTSNSITNDQAGVGTIHNCYYIDSCGLSSSRATSVTAEQLASGEVCYNLNSNQKSINWYQNIDKGDKDNLPILKSVHYKVYDNDGKYSNILFGDIDSNDKIDNADSALLLKYISGLITDINAEAADVNNDGTVDILDVVKLIKKIA